MCRKDNEARGLTDREEFCDVKEKNICEKSGNEGGSDIALFGAFGCRKMRLAQREYEKKKPWL
jgi:hypothetical protein